MKERDLIPSSEDALDSSAFDDLLIDLAPPPPPNIEVHFDKPSEAEKEGPPPRFASRPSEGASGPFRSALSGDSPREVIESAEWLRTLSDRVEGRHRARLLGVVSRLLERGDDPRHEKLLESALLEAPDNAALLRRASALAERRGEASILRERLKAELAHLHDPLGRVPRAIKLAEAHGATREGMALARELREAHQGEADLALFSLLIAERFGDPNELAQALAAAIKSVESMELKARLALRLAHHAVQGGQHAAAKAWAEFAAGADPSNDAAYIIGIKAARALRDYDALGKTLRAWIRSLGEGPLRRSLLRWSFRLNRALGDQLALPEALLEDEESGSIYRLRAELALARGDRQAARDALRRLIRHAGPHEQATALRDLAILAAQDGDRALAHRALKEASYLESEGEEYAARLWAVIERSADRTPSELSARDNHVRTPVDPLAGLIQALMKQDLNAARALAREDRFGDDLSLAMFTSHLELLHGDGASAAAALFRELEARPREARAGIMLMLLLLYLEPTHPELARALNALPSEDRARFSSLIRLGEAAKESGVSLVQLAASSAARSDASGVELRRLAIRGELEEGRAFAAPTLREVFLLASRRAIPDTLFDPSPSLQGQGATNDPIVRLAEAKAHAAAGDLARAKERLIPADNPELKLALSELELQDDSSERARALLRELLSTGAISAPPQRAAHLLEAISSFSAFAGDWLLALEWQLHLLSSEELLVALERALFELPRRGAFDLLSPELIERHRAHLPLLELLECVLSDGPALLETLTHLGRASENPGVKRARLSRAAAIAETMGDESTARALREEASAAAPRQVGIGSGNRNDDDPLSRGLASIDSALLRGELEAAEARYDALEFDHPHSPALALRRARILKEKKQNEGAIQTLRDLLGQALGAELRRDALLELARLLDGFRGDSEAAIACLEQLLEESTSESLKEHLAESGERASQDAEALCLLAPLKLRAGARAEARALLYRAIDAVRGVVLSESARAAQSVDALSSCLAALGLRASAELLGSLHQAHYEAHYKASYGSQAPRALPSIFALPHSTDAVSSDLIDSSHLEFFRTAQPAFGALAPFNLNAYRLQAFEASAELKARLKQALGGPPPALYQCDAPPSLIFSADPHGRRVVIHSGLLDGLGTREFFFLCLSAIVRARLGVAFIDREPPEHAAALLNALFHASSASPPYPSVSVERTLFDGASLALAGEDPRITELARNAPRLPPIEALGRRLNELSLRLVLLGTGDMVGAKRALEACERHSDGLSPIHAFPSFERLLSFSLSRPAIERRHLLSRSAASTSASPGT